MIDKAIKIIQELWRYEHTDKYTDEEIRTALTIAISALETVKTLNSQENCKKVLKYIRSYCKTHMCNNCQFHSWCYQVDGECPKSWSLYRIEQIGKFKENDNG